MLLTRLTTRILLPLVILIAAAVAIFFVIHKGPFLTHMAPAPPVTSGSAIKPAPVAPPADCLLPGPPPVPPDGHTATEAEMKLGQVVIQNFVNQLEAYQSCRNNQADHAAPTVSAQQRSTWIDQGNSAVDEANDIAGAFSMQLKIFKARHPKQ
jgi:hypothetical protein